VSSGAACSKDAVVTTRSVIANVPTGCAVDGMGYATYFALGDFEPAAPPPGPYLSQVGQVLTQIDTNAQALVVTASEDRDAAGAGGNTWEGVATIPPSGDVNVLVLPQDLSCALTTTVGARSGSTLAAIGSERALLVGGTGNPTPADFVIRLDTGQVTQVPPQLELQHARAQASVTPFGPGGLVAGGVDDVTNLPTGSAQVYDPGAGGFTTPVSLSVARARHAAVVLVDGSTLLVGGVGADGTTAVEQMEIVAPGDQNGHVQGVASIDPPLAMPITAVRLASGEVLVAGGTTVGGVSATGLQWFTPGALPSMVMMQTLPGGHLALVPLESGGALAVVAAPSGAPAGFQNTWVISAEHTVTAATAVPGSLTLPLLFGGAGGAPLLWTGDRWLQWQPWAGAFTSAPVLDSMPANIGDAFASPDPGLAMWLDPVRKQLVALRTDTSNAFSADPPAFLAQGSTGVAPDSLPAGDTATYTGGTGLLLAQYLNAFVTDRTYADVSVRVAFAAGQPPFVVLRDDQGTPHVLQQDCCVGLLSASGPQPVVDVERTGATVTCSVNGAAATTCSTTLDAGARVAVGVQGALPTNPSIVSEIVVKRLGAP
jgi:hypothetical protein